jgi:hypothetical protein
MTRAKLRVYACRSRGMKSDGELRVCRGGRNDSRLAFFVCFLVSQRRSTFYLPPSTNVEVCLSGLSIARSAPQIMVQTRSKARAALAKKADNPFRILDLPQELVEQMFTFPTDLWPFALLQARFVCRAFQFHSLNAFGTSFFEHVIAVLHPLTLAILVEITSHPQLLSFVRQVAISGETDKN